MESKFARAALWLVLAAGAPAAGAQSYSPLTVGDLDAVMQEEIYFKALADRNAAEKAMNESKGGGGGGGSKTTLPAAPELIWRRATADGWVAKLAFSGGSSVLARAGDMLPGGFKTVRVDADSVTVSRGEQEFVLNAVSPRQKTSTAAGSLPAPASPAFIPPAPAIPDGRFPIGGPQ